jgi:hypothetical protein
VANTCDLFMLSFVLLSYMIMNVTGVTRKVSRCNSWANRFGCIISQFLGIRLVPVKSSLVNLFRECKLKHVTLSCNQSGPWSLWESTSVQWFRSFINGWNKNQSFKLFKVLLRVPQMPSGFQNSERKFELENKTFVYIVTILRGNLGDILNIFPPLPHCSLFLTH